MSGAPALRLPLVFAADELARDVAGLDEREWTAHFNTGYHDGGWTGVALRAPADAVLPLVPEPGRAYVDTPALARCPSMRRALEAFDCPVGSVRLLRLAPGSVIREHRDDGMGVETGEIRLHVPITTNPQVEFVVDGVRVDMQPGETWLVDVSRPHRVQNLGPSPRVHLVLDCAMSPWLAVRLAEGEPVAVPAGPPHGEEALGRLRERILADPVAADELWTILDPEAFVDAVLRLAPGEAACREDLHAAMRSTRNQLLHRWRVG